MDDRKRVGVGLLGMIAIVFGSMVGGGIFNIAQNMASAAGLGAVVISWLITGFGVVFLVLTFKILSDYFPKLNQGIYRYAQKGFGNYIGFNIAWGYWLCVALGNVSLIVMLNDSFGAFFPILLQHGWETILLCWAIIWLMYALVIRGVMTASFINTIMTILKFGAVIIIITLLFVYLNTDLLFSDIWSENYSGDSSSMNGLHNQIMGTMLVTMFCFVGVEGAVMLAPYAKRQSDIGKASVIGFYCALIIYALVSILCYGVRSREELVEMHDPSVAYVLKSVCGDWAYYFVIWTLILSLFSGLIAWTLLCAETPYGAALKNMLPKQFLKTNSRNIPAYGLAVSSVFMSLFMFLVCTAPNVYLASLNLTTIMVLPAYAFSGAFLWKMTMPNGSLQNQVDSRKLLKFKIISIICTIYCIWCIFAGGALLFLATSIFYAIGIWFYYSTWKETKEGKLLTNWEWVLFSIIILCSILSIVLICLGKISLN